MIDVSPIFESPWFNVGITAAGLLIGITTLYRLLIRPRVDNRIEASENRVSVKLKKFKIDVKEEIKKESEQRMEAYQTVAECNKIHQNLDDREKEQNAAYVELLNTTNQLSVSIAELKTMTQDNKEVMHKLLYAVTNKKE